MKNAVQRKVHTYLLENGFINVDKDSHAIIRNFNADNLLYEMTACLTVTWSGEQSTLYKIIDGFLCVANFYPSGDFSYFINRPAAAHDLQHIVDTLYNITLKAGLNALPVWDIEERFLDDYLCLKGYAVKTEYNDAMSEYVYSAESLLDLHGGINMNKRHQVGKFIDKPNITVQTITRENINLCLDIENQWCSLRDCSLCESFAGCSKKTMEIMSGIFDNSVYRGILGYVDGTLAGYLIFEKTNEYLAYIHFVKAVIPNFSVYLYYFAAQRFLNDVRQINNGADLGNQGLRLFKRRLGVHELLKKYLCTFTKEG